MRAIFAMDAGLPNRLFDGAALAALTGLVELDTSRTVRSWDQVPAAELAAVDVVVTGWGAPRVDAAALSRMPRLRAILHAAGTVKGVVSPGVFDRPITVTTAARANAVPVAEFTLAQILLAGKRAHAIEGVYRARRGAIDLLREYPSIGNYGSTVGIIGASTIGTMVAELLKPFDMTVLIHDPYAGAERISALGAVSAGLDELLAGSDVVSVHAPDTPETQHMLHARRLGLMRDGATLINTARPALIDQAALRAELLNGRIAAVLDVTDPEPPERSDELWSLPNVTLTPHLAGSAGHELHRLGASALEEVRRFVAGQPPRFPVTKQMLATMA